jgi:hypothetical protein
LFPLVRAFTLELAQADELNALRRNAALYYETYLSEHVGHEREGTARALDYDVIEKERENIFSMIDWCFEANHWSAVRALILGMDTFHMQGVIGKTR